MKSLVIAFLSSRFVMFVTMWLGLISLFFIGYAASNLLGERIGSVFIARVIVVLASFIALVNISAKSAR